MNSNIQSFDEYIKTSHMSRKQLLMQMLETKSPAFVFNCILNNESTQSLKESLFFQLNESRPLLGRELFANRGVAVKGGAKRTKGRARGTGHGSLKDLISSSNLNNNPSACMQIGEQIAYLRDDPDNNLDARDYVGMINFLKSSCDIAMPILSSAKAAQRKASRNTIRESKDTYDEFDEANDFEFTTSKSKFDDMIKRMSSSLIDILNIGRSEEDIDDFNDEYDEFMDSKEESEEGENKFNAINAMSTNYYGDPVIGESKGYDNGSYSRSDLAAIRTNRGNGKGGLKSYVGKTTGDDLTANDVKTLSKMVKHISDPDINGQPSRDKLMARDILNKVRFMANTCPIVRNIIKGYVSTLSGSPIKFKGYSGKYPSI